MSNNKFNIHLVYACHNRKIPIHGEGNGAFNESWGLLGIVNDKRGFLICSFLIGKDYKYNCFVLNFLSLTVLPCIPTRKIEFLCEILRNCNMFWTQHKLLLFSIVHIWKEIRSYSTVMIDVYPSTATSHAVCNRKEENV